MNFVGTKNTRKDSLHSYFLQHPLPRLENTLPQLLVDTRRFKTQEDDVFIKTITQPAMAGS